MSRLFLSRNIEGGNGAAGARDLTATGSVQLSYGEVVTGGDPKCPMCRVDIESVVKINSQPAEAAKQRSKKGKKSKHKVCQAFPTFTPFWLRFYLCHTVLDTK
jgi:hypothetical protein